MGVFDSSNEAQGRTDYNAKNSTFYDVPLMKKSRKTPQNDHFKKSYYFCRFFLIFSATLHRKELRLFAL